MKAKKKRETPVARLADFGGAAAAVGLLTFAVYLPTLWSGFVYDAEAQILIGDYIHNRANLFEVVTFGVLGRDVLDFNRPVQLFSLMVDSFFWGRNPVGYHLTSNLIHALNAALVFLLIVRVLPGVEERARSGIAALCALGFAFHPVNVEAVAEVSCREDLLATMFVLLGLLLAEGFARHGGWRGRFFAAGCVLSLFLACGAKETGVAGPFLLGGYWLFFQRGQPWRRWAGLVVAAFAVAAGFFVMRFSLQPEDSQIFLHPPQYLGGSLAKVLEIQPRLWAFLLKCVFWPFGLSADYEPTNVMWITLPAAVIVLAIFVALQLWLAWKSPLGALGAVMFWLALASVSNFVPMYRPLADRFLYMPLAGMALMTAGTLVLAARRREILVPLLAGGTLLLAPLAVLNLKRQAVFSSSLALWLDTTTKSPTSNTAANNLGYAYLAANEPEAALKAFERVLKMTNGKYADAQAGAAMALERMGRKEEAEQALQQAIALEARYSDPPKLVKALTTSRENAALLQEINDRLAY